MFLQLLANGLVTGSVYAIAALGVSLVYGILRLVNFAYGDMMAFAALIAYGTNGPLHQSMVVAAGFSGHGFMIAPAVARIVADAVFGQRDPVLDVLGVDRFAADRLVPEPQLV